MTFKILFLHRLTIGRKHKKAIFKIIEKANNKIFRINAFAEPFYVIVIDFFLNVLPRGSQIKLETLHFCINYLLAFQKLYEIVILW